MVLDFRLIENFLSNRLIAEDRLLLAISGGGDSMALLHLLIEVQKRGKYQFSLHLAHINHQLRPESDFEARYLQNFAKEHNYPFHLKTLINIQGPDLENRCRQERLAFFQDLNRTHKFKAIFLGHHRTDQYETVFKRIAEGSSLIGLGGLRCDSTYQTIRIWRPLLDISKKMIYQYLQKNQIFHFEDVTNQDPSFLRSRMRTQLFPKIEKIFGKNIEKNFAKFGRLCDDLRTYFEEKSRQIEKKLIHGPFGCCLLLDPALHALELEFFFKKNFQLNHDEVQNLLKIIHRQPYSKKIVGKFYECVVNKQYLFIFKQPVYNFFDNVLDWTPIKGGDWQDFWKGKIKIPTEESVQMFAIKELNHILKDQIIQRYKKRAIPSVLYDIAPIFVLNNKKVFDVLT